MKSTLASNDASTRRTSLPLFKLSPWLAIGTVLSLLPILYHYVTHNIPADRLIVGSRFMAPATMVVFALTSVALVFGGPRSQPPTWFSRFDRLSKCAAWSSLLFSVGLALSLVIAGQDKISPWLTRMLFDLPPAMSGQVTTALILGLVCISLAQCLRLSNRQRTSCLVALLPLLLSGSALLGYAYGVRELYVFWNRTFIALHSSGALFTLSLATLLGQAKPCWFAPLVSNGPGGHTARRLFIFTLAIPLLGLLLIQRAASGQINFGMALALLVIVTVAPMLSLILHIGATQDRLDDEHQARERVQELYAEDLNLRLAEQARSLRHESEERAKAESVMYRAQRMEAVGQLTGGIAHDFNNLLMAISASHHILRQHIAPGHPGYKHLSNASAATHRGEKLTSQLLTFSRTQRLDIQPTDLRGVMDFTLAMVSNALGPTIKVDCTLHGEGLYVLADANQLEMALLNLALNARDAMPDGGTFTLKTASEVVHAAHGPERYIAISVTDSGVGMPPEVAARAIEPFFTTKSQGRGTGLGLAQVYGLVKQCGGMFRLQSDLGKGTMIEMVLPETRAPADKKPTVAANDRQAWLSTPKSIVLIDDDENVRTALAEVLRGEGYVVTEAEDGYVGLERLKEIRPAAAIIDFLMPGLNGAETARIARADMPGLPIIFVSGYADTLALDQISKAVVLRKPVDIDRLLATVESVTCG